MTMKTDYDVVTDAELFPNLQQRSYLDILPEVDQENVRAWKRIVTALQDRVTVHNDGTISVRGIFTPMQMRAIAGLAAFNHSSQVDERHSSVMFGLWRVRGSI